MTEQEWAEYHYDSVVPGTFDNMPSVQIIPADLPATVVDWQPISSAPPMCSGGVSGDMLVWAHGMPMFAYRDCDKNGELWRICTGDGTGQEIEPTHWAPRPEGPKV